MIGLKCDSSLPSALNGRVIWQNCFGSSLSWPYWWPYEENSLHVVTWAYLFPLSLKKCTIICSSQFFSSFPPQPFTIGFEALFLNLLQLWIPWFTNSQSSFLILERTKGSNFELRARTLYHRHSGKGPFPLRTSFWEKAPKSTVYFGRGVRVIRL